jgi:hypothetical protein
MIAAHAGIKKPKFFKGLALRGLLVWAPHSVGKNFSPLPRIR